MSRTFKQRERLWQDHKRLEVIVIPRYLKLETPSQGELLRKGEGRD